MNKVYGRKNDFATLREDTSRWIVSYSMEPETDGNYATWYEIYFYKKQHPNIPTVEEMKKAITDNINARTDERILSGFVWTPPADSPEDAAVPDASPSGINVWLSEENQRNFSEAQRVAMITNGQSLPMTFKLGEDADGNPIYHQFATVEELTDFYLQAVAYINQCLNDGWQEKDSINIDSSE